MSATNPFTFSNGVFFFGMSGFGTFLVQMSYNFTDHVFLLLLLTLASYLLAYGLSKALHHYFEVNDGKIDYKETVYLTPFQCAIWLMGIMLPQYFFKLVTEAFTAWVPPMWYEGLSLAFVLLILIIAFSIYLEKTMASLTPVVAAVKAVRTSVNHMILAAGAYLASTHNIE